MKNGTNNSRVGNCPTCGQPGKAVKPVTLQSLLRPEAKARMPAKADWHFCGNPDCATVYFAEPVAPVFGKDDLTVRVGIKEREAPRPVCYCFNHTIEEIEDEVRRRGQSTVVDDIKTRMKSGCWCETRNPLGSCCLATVNHYVRSAMAMHGQSGSTAKEEREGSCRSDTRPQGQSAHACCDGEERSQTTATGPGVPPSGGSGERPAKAAISSLGRLSLFGGLLAAMMASACC